jgi:transglutaminase-like putative cysteine protease
LTSVIVLTSALCTFADDAAPTWLKQAASQTPPTYEKTVPGVVLHDEEQVTMEGDKLVTTDNWAIKLLTREGRGLAVAQVYYLVSSGKVRDISAWMIRPDGTVKHYDKKTVIDIIADTDDVYNEGRKKIIDASDDVDIGYIFGYTTVSENTPLFYQDHWEFQGRLPTLMSRYSLNLPSGWKASSITFNYPDVKAQTNGSSYVWELRNLSPIRPEPLSPAVVNLAPRIVVNYSSETSSNSANRVFANWADVSRWATALYDPQVIIDDNIAAKARDLTAGAQTELEKIRAIGNYVQGLQYISIDIGVAYGNGYRPRASTTVLGRGYGDCKDKANLMRALLRAIKIDAYPVVIFSGDPAFVREQWASPSQFNHCIIAVRVSEATNTPTIINPGKLGRLLIFDATDPYTPVGDLPDHLQGGYALIIAGDDGSLAKMPVTPAETDLVQRDIEVKLNAAGELKGTIRERSKGQASTDIRTAFRSIAASDFRKAIEGWLTNGAIGARLDDLQTRDAEDRSFFLLDIAFSVQRYGQIMQDRLLVFKPVIVGRRNGVSLTEITRTNPIDIKGSSMKETAVFTLPDGFVVDEMPDAANLQTQFGSYSTKYEVIGDTLKFTRTLNLSRMTLPVDKYSVAREFFLKIRDAEQAPVVLIRK